MPFVDLTITHATAFPRAMQAVRHGLTRLMADVLRKRADLTVVAVHTGSGSDLSVGGASLAPGSWSGRLIAYVTQGTNTDEEKARFLDAAYELLAAELGAPASPFYIVVQDLPAAAWGYDGRSQADRAQAAAQAA